MKPEVPVLKKPLRFEQLQHCLTFCDIIYSLPHSHFLRLPSQHDTYKIENWLSMFAFFWFGLLL